MVVEKRVGLVECRSCSAWVEVLRAERTGETRLYWHMRDSALCTAPPLYQCAAMRGEVAKCLDACAGQAVLQESA